MKRRFEWDPKKARLNEAKHGVSFFDAVTVFSDPFALSQFDETHSGREDRWILLGCSESERILLVVHTVLEMSDFEEVVRLISARKATQNEKRQYLDRRPE
jgi:hypothetical protein